MTFYEAIAALRAAGIEEAETEARILFSELGGIPSYKLHTENPTLTDPRLESAIADVLAVADGVQVAVAEMKRPYDGQYGCLYDFSFLKLVETCFMARFMIKFLLCA